MKITSVDLKISAVRRSQYPTDNHSEYLLVGKSNVGKSSLMNALLNEERVVVSNVAGTTRDSIDSVLRYHNEEYVLIDTAGMRKKGKIYRT